MIQLCETKRCEISFAMICNSKAFEVRTTAETFTRKMKEEEQIRH